RLRHPSSSPRVPPPPRRSAIPRDASVSVPSQERTRKGRKGEEKSRAGDRAETRRPDRLGDRGGGSRREWRTRGGEAASQSEFRADDPPRRSPSRSGRRVSARSPARPRLQLGNLRENLVRVRQLAFAVLLDEPYLARPVDGGGDP